MQRIAHRGAPHEAPENSLEGFEAALRFSPDMVEMDVRVSKDGELVIMHDPTVDRTTSGRGKVVRMTMRQLRECRLANGEAVPTFAEAVALLKGRSDLKVDVKDVGIEDFVAEELRRAGVVRRTIVIAYGERSLAAFRAACPGLRTEVGGIHSHHQRGGAIALAARVGATVISTRHGVVSRKFSDDCRAKGLAIHAWTVNDAATAARMRGMGVAAVATDRLDIV
jgi:glycerophosphoryl diester phosphodiesterase